RFGRLLGEAVEEIALGSPPRAGDALERFAAKHRAEQCWRQLHEELVRAHLGAMALQRGAFGPDVARDVDERGDLYAVDAIGRIVPRGVHCAEGWLDAGRAHALAELAHGRARKHRVVQLERLPRFSRVGVTLRIAGALEGSDGDQVSADVIRVTVAAAFVVGD